LCVFVIFHCRYINTLKRKKKKKKKKGGASMDEVGGSYLSKRFVSIMVMAVRALGKRHAAFNTLNSCFNPPLQGFGGG